MVRSLFWMSVVSRAPGTFDANEHDRREMSAVFDENPAHRDDAPACFLLGMTTACTLLTWKLLS